jgi:hypothetical protein
MRALEKDPEQRFQSAWEMQSELDRFLSSNEFSPSNQHLATFMKQLFADEMDAERARVTAPKEMQRPPVEAEENGEPSGPRYLGVPGARQETLPGKGQKTRADALEVPFQPEELAHLSELAERHQLSVGALVREIVQGYLRFL